MGGPLLGVVEVGPECFDVAWTAAFIFDEPCSGVLLDRGVAFDAEFQRLRYGVVDGAEDPAELLLMREYVAAIVD
ncbi:hypothetical protein [Agromyces sp. S2-1-8]|uniref:hypothetical protein n=1 Tax=Agromyces sp. S2-1-8 TaxID=2897180 RepID=UPI001E54A414|nr:hypothetical protein [Agromyces sp. S2-1-8]MCD5348402.1 hypothetical protein [Agromyces sp. S2-1-8]